MKTLDKIDNLNEEFCFFLVKAKNTPHWKEKEFTEYSRKLDWVVRNLQLSYKIVGEKFLEGTEEYIEASKKVSRSSTLVESGLKEYSERFRRHGSALAWYLLKNRLRGLSLTQLLEYLKEIGTDISVFEENACFDASQKGEIKIAGGIIPACISINKMLMDATREGHSY